MVPVGVAKLLEVCNKTETKEELLAKILTYTNEYSILRRRAHFARGAGRNHINLTYR